MRPPATSVTVDLTYDRKRLDQAINRIAGTGLSPKEILDVPEGAQGPPEVRHRAHVAFRTAWEIVGNLAKVTDRRKAFIYVSSGYDLAPFRETRARLDESRAGRSGDPGSYPDTNPFTQSRNQFSDADLAAELAELTRAANRANVTFYPIDPRGLVAGPDIDQDVRPAEWHDHVRKAQDSLRVLADLTGGVPIINSNDFTRGPEAHRRGNQRLLRAGLLLVEHGSRQTPPPHRGQIQSPRRQGHPPP